MRRFEVCTALQRAADNLNDPLFQHPQADQLRESLDGLLEASHRVIEEFARLDTPHASDAKHLALSTAVDITNGALIELARLLE